MLPFYSDKEGKRFREFSNFYQHARPFEFVLPSFAQRAGFPRSVWCDFSEKAIMASKATLMGDLEIFNEIDAARDPKSCKALGRGVRDFDDDLWQRHLEEVAFEVVRQKFMSEKRLRELLLSTGAKILVEAAPNDRIWGAGLPLSDGRIRDPSQWQGRNILGYALMRARDHIRGLRARPDGPDGNAPDEPIREPRRSSAPCADTSEAILQVDDTTDITPDEAHAPGFQLPVMNDANGSPLLLYRDGGEPGTERLSKALLGGPLRIMFLDVDGVLNKRDFTSSVEDDAELLSPSCLAHLRSTLEATGVRIVLSSTWRSEEQLRTTIVSTLESMRPGCVVGQTPQDISYRNDMRPDEIAGFLALPTVAEALAIPTSSWCAVDDMDLIRQAEALSRKKQHHRVYDLLPSFRTRFIKTDKSVGLDGPGGARILHVLSSELSRT